MTLAINGKEYQIKYSIAATLCEECVERTTDVIMRFHDIDGGDGSDAANNAALRQFFHSMSGVAPTVLAMLYGGLIQYHGRRGDKSVMSKDDAEDLLVAYMEEHADDEDGNMYALWEKLMGQMEKDNFFKQIGVEAVLNRTKNADEKNTKAGAKSSTKR